VSRFGAGLRPPPQLYEHESGDFPIDLPDTARACAQCPCLCLRADGGRGVCTPLLLLCSGGADTKTARRGEPLELGRTKPKYHFLRIVA
jgi:hypothetical protein